MPEAQAQVPANELGRLIDDRLATLDAATRAEIARLELITKATLAEAKVYTLKWALVGMMGFQTIVIVGAFFGLVVH